MQFFTILLDKLHSFDFQEDRSTQYIDLARAKSEAQISNTYKQEILQLISVRCIHPDF